MITDSMVGKVYDRINFWDHGEEGIAEGLEQVFRENLGELLAGADDLDRAQAALVRERVIREVMAKSGEPRDIVVEMIEAMKSMADEAVLGLMEGEPTTLRAALQRYVDSLVNNSHSGNLEEVADDLASILGYPYPQADAGPGRELEIRQPDDEHLEVWIGGREVASANHDEHGWSGMEAVQSTAEGVHKALTS